MGKGTADDTYREYIGADLGTVTILRELGRGTGAVVFVGFQRTLQRQVAVKVLPKRKQIKPSSSERFSFEARLVAGLSHPNIVPIFEMGETETCYYQIMQIIQGEDLEKIVKRKKENPIPSRRLFPLKRTHEIISQVLRGLEYAHGQHVVHQDIKPANILLEGDNGRALIADFGIAKAKYFDAASGEHFVIGSPLYMAPEHAANRHTDGRADIYSVGMVLYQMTAVQLPLAVSSPIDFVACKVRNPQGIFTKPPCQASELITLPLERIILKAIAPRADDRYQSCGEFRRDFDALFD